MIIPKRTTHIIIHDLVKKTESIMKHCTVCMKNTKQLWQLEEVIFTLSEETPWEIYKQLHYTVLKCLVLSRRTKIPKWMFLPVVPWRRKLACQNHFFLSLNYNIIHLSFKTVIVILLHLFECIFNVTLLLSVSTIYHVRYNLSCYYWLAIEKYQITTAYVSSYLNLINC